MVFPHSAQRGNTRIAIKAISNVTPITNQRRRTWVLTWPVAYIIATTANAPEMTPIHNDTDYIPNAGTKLSTGRRGLISLGKLVPQRRKFQIVAGQKLVTRPDAHLGGRVEKASHRSVRLKSDRVA